GVAAMPLRIRRGTLAASGPRSGAADGPRGGSGTTVAPAASVWPGCAGATGPEAWPTAPLAPRPARPRIGGATPGGGRCAPAPGGRTGRGGDGAGGGVAGWAARAGG